MTSFFRQIMQMSISASYVILAVLFCRLFLKHAPKKYSYLLWSVVGFRLCFPFSVSSVLSIFNLTLRRQGQTVIDLTEVPVTYETAEREILELGVPAATEVLQETVRPAPVPEVLPSGPTGPALTPEITEIQPSVPSVTEIPSSVSSIDVEKILCILWIIGIAAMLIYSVVSYLRVKKQSNYSLPLRDNIRRMETRTPFILGLVHPTIYLPFGLDPMTENIAVSHERHHLHRKDHLIKLFSYLLLCLHWINPLCWIAYFEMGKDMEMSCDEYVLSHYREIAKDYGTALLSFSTGRRFSLASPLAFGESSIKERILNVMRHRKASKTVTVMAAVVCIVALVACGTNGVLPGEKEIPLVEGYSGRTILRFSDPYGGEESELQALFTDGENVYCAVTDRRAAETVRYVMSGGTIETITSLSWLQTKIGAYDYQTGGHTVQAEEAELIDERDQGFAFLPDGSFAVVGYEDGYRILTVYADTVTKTVGVDGYGLPLYKDRITIGKAEQETARFEMFPADDHSIVLISVRTDDTEPDDVILVDLNKRSSSAVAVQAEMFENGICRDGLLYCCVDGELQIIDLLTGDSAEEFEPFPLQKKGEEDGIRILGVSGDSLLWADAKGIHILSLTEKEDYMLGLSSDEYEAKNGWSIRKACIDGSGDIYLHYERTTETACETSLVCYSKAQAQDTELMPLQVTGTIFDSNYCDAKGIHLTEIITDRFQPEELWNEGHTYFTDIYQLHLYADYDDPVLRPSCTIQGCDHRSPSCEAWALRSKGYPYEFLLEDSILTITQFRGDLYPSEDPDPRFPSGTGILIEKSDRGRQAEYQTAIPDAYLYDCKLYFDGRNLVFTALQHGVVVYVFDTQTGTVMKRIHTELSDGRFSVSEKNQIVLADVALQKGLVIDTSTWQCGVMSGIKGVPDWYNFVFDGSSYTAEPMYDFSLLEDIPNPYGLEHSQVFMKHGDKGLVRFSSDYRDETAIVDLISREVLSGTVPMKNVWGEDCPNIYLESEKYYIFSPGVVWHSSSFPAPPDYFDGAEGRSTYRTICAFIEKEAFWNGDTEYTEFVMP